MGTKNQTYLTEFILLGLSADQQTQIVLFVIFLIIYLLTVFGNLLIILLIHIDSRLHTPMYFFLKNLSFSDLLFSTTIVPQMLFHLLVTRKTISKSGCSIQMIFFPSSRVYRKLPASSNVLRPLCGCLQAASLLHPYDPEDLCSAVHRILD